VTRVIPHYALLMIMRQDTTQKLCKLQTYLRLAAFVIPLRAADLYFIIRVHIGNTINNDDMLSAVYDSKHSLASGY